MKGRKEGERDGRGQKIERRHGRWHRGGENILVYECNRYVIINKYREDALTIPEAPGDKFLLILMDFGAPVLARVLDLVSEAGLALQSYPDADQEREHYCVLCWSNIINKLVTESRMEHWSL